MSTPDVPDVPVADASRVLTPEIARHELQGMRVCDVIGCPDPSLHVFKLAERVEHRCDGCAAALLLVFGTSCQDESNAAHIRALLELAALA